MKTKGNDDLGSVVDEDIIVEVQGSQTYPHIVSFKRVSGEKLDDRKACSTSSI